MAGRATKTTAEVVSSSLHTIILGDGSMLDLGNPPVKIDMDDPVNRGHYFDGHLTILEGFTPRTRHAEELEVADTAPEDPGTKTEENS